MPGVCGVPGPGDGPAGGVDVPGAGDDVPGAGDDVPGAGAGSRSCGAVRVSTVTPKAMTANAAMAMAIFTGLLVNRSSNSQTLKMMLANGSVMTKIGCDTLSGPTCSAACCSTVPVIVAPTSA